MKPAALRPVDAFPLEDGGRTWLALRDLEGWSEQLLLLSALQAQVAGRLDGRQTAAQVSVELARHGHQVSAAQVAAFARQLDEAWFLDSPRFQKRVRRETAAFRKAKTRPAVLAGRSYAAKPADLELEMAAFFSRPGAPGAGNRLSVVEKSNSSRSVSSEIFDMDSISLPPAVSFQLFNN